LIFRAVERLLVIRTGTFGACNQRERDLARSLSRGLRIVDVMHVPNVPQEYCEIARPPEHYTQLTVAAVGRLCQQKDPRFFAATVKHATRLGFTPRWVWIGDGDQAMRHELEDLGVEVTGWQPRSEVLATLGASSIFFHTAAWEANPLAVLEAAAVGLPVVARSVPAMEGAPVGRWVSEPVEAAGALMELEDQDRWASCLRRTRAALTAIPGDSELARSAMLAYGLCGAESAAAATAALTARPFPDD
jgi:glycosyltransferase involved in cell wall biosynthesis